MGLNPEKDAERRARTQNKILKTAFRVFAERTIDAVNLTDIAIETGVSMTTVYHYYNTKEKLVLEVGAWAWKQYTENDYARLELPGRTAAEDYEYFPDSFINLYRNNRDILRFNPFSTFMCSAKASLPKYMRPYNDVIEAIEQRFHVMYERAKEDGTLRTDIPEREMFSVTLHLMLAVVTRYAVGLVYDGGIEPEHELMVQRNFLLEAYRVKILTATQ